jgi:hypothetical protein
MKIAILSAFAVVAFTPFAWAGTIIMGTLTGVVADEYGYTTNNAASVSNSDSTGLFGGGVLNGDPFSLSFSYDATTMAATGDAGTSLLNTSPGGGGFFDESLSIVTGTGTYAVTLDNGADNVAYTCANAAEVTGGCADYNEYLEYAWDNPGDGLFIESFFFNYDAAPASAVTTQAFIDSVLDNVDTYNANPPAADTPVSFANELGHKYTSRTKSAMMGLAWQASKNPRGSTAECGRIMFVCARNAVLRAF